MNISSTIRLKQYLTKLKRDQQGIIRRYRREKENWNSHLNNTKTFISNSLPTEKQQKAIVMGSGWLLDVDVETLLQKFEFVEFADIYHPPAIVKKYRANKNIHFAKKDLTFGAIKLCADMNSENRFTFIKDLSRLIPPEDFTADFYISLNLLSQLDWFIYAFLNSRKIFSNKEMLEIRSLIQTQHIRFISLQNSCLISDLEEELYGENNELVATKPLVYTSIPEGAETTEWKWKFDTTGMYNEDYKTIMSVKAVRYTR